MFDKHDFIRCNCGQKWVFVGFIYKLSRGTQNKVGMYFRGENAINLDAKGRLAIPSRYRQGLLDLCAAQMVIAPHPHEPCLLLYPLPIWIEIEDKINDMPSFDDLIVRRLQRRFIGKAKDVTVDKNGRILLAPEFRKNLELDKKIFLIGLGKKFEIWRDDLWLEQDALWDQDKPEISKALRELAL